MSRVRKRGDRESFLKSFPSLFELISLPPLEFIQAFCIYLDSDTSLSLPHY